MEIIRDTNAVIGNDLDQNVSASMRDNERCGGLCMTGTYSFLQTPYSTDEIAWSSTARVRAKTGSPREVLLLSSGSTDEPPGKHGRAHPTPHIDPPASGRLRVRCRGRHARRPDRLACTATGHHQRARRYRPGTCHGMTSGTGVPAFHFAQRQTLVHCWMYTEKDCQDSTIPEYCRSMESEEAIAAFARLRSDG